MTKTEPSEDWDPGAYARFQDLRLRPGLDLLNAIAAFGPGDTVDLGCGNGALSSALRHRAAERSLIGVDTSPAMLAEARETKNYARLETADIATWEPASPVSVIFSNAALHWLDGHDRLMPRLASFLVSGGTLAVQMPHQNKAPSHRVWLTLAQELFPGRVAPANAPGVMTPQDYEAALAPLGHFRLWETEYYQRLLPEPDAHPVRRFTESTYARPILQELAPDERTNLITRYEEVMR
ncbi:MAG: methyltransferase domain-containing protein, partial [Pseudomonadota bacterium]